MMDRCLEPELMEEAAQALAYAQADFEAPHGRVIELFRQTFPDWSGTGRVLDIGCGPGDIAMRFARAYPDCTVDGIDGAPAMLEVGRRLLEKDPALRARVSLHQAFLPADRPPADSYHAVISNSLLHHLHDPFVLWDAIARYAQPDAPIFIVDLMRPASRAIAEQLTVTYCEGEPEVLRHDFFHSLLAAFTVEEIQAQLDRTPLASLQVNSISDRHVMMHGIGTLK